jgi:hypothetical protein
VFGGRFETGQEDSFHFIETDVCDVGADEG